MYNTDGARQYHRPSYIDSKEALVISNQPTTTTTQKKKNCGDQDKVFSSVDDTKGQSNCSCCVYASFIWAACQLAYYHGKTTTLEHVEDVGGPLMFDDLNRETRDLMLMLEAVGGGEKNDDISSEEEKKTEKKDPSVFDSLCGFDVYRNSV